MLSELKTTQKPEARTLHLRLYDEFTAQCAQRNITPTYNLFTLWMDVNKPRIVDIERIKAIAASHDMEFYLHTSTN